MMKVNGTPLDNPALGWIFRSGSVPYSALESATADVRVVGRDGLVSTPTTLNAPVWPLKINTPPSGWEALLALFSTPTLILTDDDRPGLEVRVSLKSATPDRVFTRNEWLDATFVVELTEVYWREKLATTYSVALSAASVALDLFPGISGVVSDAIVRLQGGATGVRVTDASGAWAALPNAGAGEFVRFESSTGRCFRTVTDTWSGGVDISGLVDFGGPRSNFEITPVLAAGDPSTRVARLTVTSVTRLAAALAVRGKTARIF